MDFISIAEAQNTLIDNGHRILSSLVKDKNQLSNSELDTPDFELDVNAPLLSPSASAELFNLATNFLLYVAMVIIITMVAKIYFPESLDRSMAADLDVRSHSVSYKMVDEEELSSESESEDETESLVDSKIIEDDNEAMTPKRKSKQNVKKKKEASKKESNFSIDIGFDQENTSKAVVLKRLLNCILLLNITFVAWGVLQERMLTRRYPRYTGEYFTYSYALVFSNRLWTSIMSGLFLYHMKPSLSRSTILYEFSFPSISNMLSSWCQYEALKYVSFPAVTLFKSFKLLPVMVMGKILGNKEYPQYDYVVALLIGIGIVMFMASTDDLELGQDIYGDEVPQAWTGIMLLFLYLFFDSFTGQWQSRMFKRHRDLSMFELLFATSTFSTVLSLITLIHDRELGPALDFIYRHYEIHAHFFIFSLCSTFGQLIIFYTIKNFGAVVFTLIMTTRVLLSITLSCILYDHKVTAIGFMGLMVVLGAVIYRVRRKTEGTQIIKWQGIEDEKAEELVHEWHEHLDM